MDDESTLYYDENGNRESEQAALLRETGGYGFMPSSSTNISELSEYDSGSGLFESPTESWNFGSSTPSALAAISSGGIKDTTTNKVSGYGSLRTANQTAKKVGVPSVMSTTGSYVANQLPTLNMPTFTAPARDQNRLSGLTQQYAAGGLRKLENKANQAIASAASQPGSVRKLTLREALSGYGEGVSSVMGSARKTAANEYNQEYSDLYNTAKTNWQSDAAEEQARYNAELDRLWQIAKAEAANSVA